MDTTYNMLYSGDYDPCNRPQYCKDLDRVPDPNDCHSYYICMSNSWGDFKCNPPQFKFDNATLQCVQPNTGAQCHGPCPEFNGTTTEPPIKPNASKYTSLFYQILKFFP